MVRNEATGKSLPIFFFLPFNLYTRVHEVSSVSLDNGEYIPVSEIYHFPDTSIDGAQPCGQVPQFFR